MFYACSKFSFEIKPKKFEKKVEVKKILVDASIEIFFDGHDLSIQTKIKDLEPEELEIEDLIIHQRKDKKGRHRFR